MTASAADLASAIDAAQQQFASWRHENRLTESQLAQIVEHYRLWQANLDPARDYGDLLGSQHVPNDAPDGMTAEIQRLTFLDNEIQRHIAAQRLTPGPAEKCLKETRDQLRELRQRYSGNLADNSAEADSVRKPWRLMDMLLNPRSLQALMACGGGLLFLGLVVWLWTRGIFDNPLIAASLLGGLNLAALASGGAMMLKTRYKVSGRAIALLACLLLPLNLWFYDAQGLVTLADGGHLWAPAVAICMLYAGMARWLKDPLFVYPCVAGVTMTGLLFLADQQVDRFWEVISPSTLLVVIGVACVHAERLFAPEDGPFSRQKFGAAFFRSGHVVMAAGLLVLLGGRLAGWLYEPLFADRGLFAMPEVMTAVSAKLMALVLAVVATYTYFYSQFVEGSRRFGYSALLTLLWCEVISLDLFSISMNSLVWSFLFAQSATLFGWRSWTARREGKADTLAAVLTIASGWASAWQALVFVGFETYGHVLAASVMGLICLVASRLLANSNSDGEPTETELLTLQSVAFTGSAVMVAGSLGGVLLALARLVSGEVAWQLVPLLFGQAVFAGAGVALATTAGARRTMASLAGANVLFGLLAINALTPLTFLQRGELLLTLIGMVMLVAGHAGWRRETQLRDGFVSFNLAVGSLLAAGPLVLGLLELRIFGDTTGWAWVAMHEVGVLAIGLLLLALGVLCRIRWTTLVGGLTLVTYVASLVTLIRFPDALQSVAVYMMIGGAAFFSTAVLLSVYRERLLKVPERIRNGEGVFEVLQWR